MSQRSKVIALYKHLQYLGREYPAGPEKFRIGCKKAFLKNSKENDPGKFCGLQSKNQRSLHKYSLCFLVKIDEMIAKGKYSEYSS